MVMLRRLLYFVKGMQAGDILTEDSVRSVRPVFGLAPKYFVKIIDETIKQSINCAQAVNLNLFKS